VPAFSGTNHLSFSVTDLDRSQRFYSEVLDFELLMDVGYARLYIYSPTGLVLGLHHHQEGTGQPFTELNTGLDHIGFRVSNPEELVEWEA
jgi:glyoxylase I family protein